MKAAVLKDWNELELCEIEKPVISQNEALIKVLYGGVCGSDITVYRGLHLTAVAPVVLCHEILGIIAQLPDGYNGKFYVGQRVLMNPVISCGECTACEAGHYNVCANLKLLGIHVNGGFEEYTKVSVDKLVAVEDALQDSIAVLGEPFAVAYHVTKRAGIKTGDNVLVIGAGTIGIVVALAAIQRGANVIISEINAARSAVATKLGIATIDPAGVDIVEYTNKRTGGIGFDVVIDASGSKVTAKQLPDLCKISGTILSLGLSGQAYEFVLGKVSFKEQHIIGSRLYSQDDFEAGVKMLETLSRELDISALVSDEMRLDDICEAIELMKSGKNVGKIIIKCS